MPRLLLALALLLPALPSAGEDLYSLGMEQRRRGDLQEAKRTFLKMLDRDPQSGGALEGLGLVCLSLRDYEGAREHLSRWNQMKPGSAYILWNLARADSALEREEDLFNDLRGASEADPLDLRIWRRLDDLLALRPGALPFGRIYKSIGTEDLQTARPQRIVYEGRSGGFKLQARPHRRLDLVFGYGARQEAQRNDTRGFSYFDILDQNLSFGLRARPRKGLDFAGEYGQSFLSDNKGQGVGNSAFSRAKLSGEWRTRPLTLRAKAAREPYFLRGAGGSSYFAILRDASANLEAESDVQGVTLLLRGGLEAFSEHTTLRRWSLSGIKEYGNHLFRAGFSKSYQEYTGAAPDGRIQFVGNDAWSARYRLLREDFYRADLGYSYSSYYDANRLQELDGGLALWAPFYRPLCLEYRFDAVDYRAPVDGYRSSDSTEHWVGPHLRRMLRPGWWAHLAWEHGFESDTRGAYDANAVLGETEYYLRDRLSVQLQGRLSRSTVRDDSYSLRLAGRCSF